MAFPLEEKSEQRMKVTWSSERKFSENLKLKKVATHLLVLVDFQDISQRD